MKAKLNKQQVLAIAVNVINASVPVGMGMLHFQPKAYTEDDVKQLPQYHEDEDGSILMYMDYVDGRMVKTDLTKGEDGYYHFPDYGPDPEYQSWCAMYPTYNDLLESVGVTV